MTTSGTYSFSVSRDDIIRQALLNIGKLDPFETPDAQHTQDCAIVLNMMCKQMMGKADFATGLKVWTRKRGHLFLSSTTGQYSVGPTAIGWTYAFASPTATGAVAASGVSVTLSSVVGVATGYNLGIVQTDGSLFWTTISNLAGSVATVGALPVGAPSGAQVFVYQTAAQQPILIESALLRQTDGTDTPVNILRTTQDYDILSSKVQASFQSDPTAVYYEFQLGNSNLYTDCGSAQDTTKHLVLTVMEPIQDFNNPLDTPYFPQEFYLPLCWGLSKLICPQFNRVWTQSMEDNYVLCMRIAKGKDAEVTTLFFQPGIE